MQMLVVLESYQNYQNGAVSNQLNYVHQKRGMCWGESESVEIRQMRYRGTGTLYTPKV
jgi:hypothetical protein